MRDSLARAKALLASEGYTCVAVSDALTLSSRHRGIRPLLDWIDEGVCLRGFSAADRVVGRAAAILYHILSVDRLYAETLSKSALAYLSGTATEVSYGVLADTIRNRTNTGICPMEQTVAGINDPAAALAALKEKQRELLAKQ